MPITYFLKTPPLLLHHKPPGIYASFLKILGVTISSNFKEDIHNNNIIHKAKAPISFLKLLNKVSSF